MNARPVPRRHLLAAIAVLGVGAFSVAAASGAYEGPSAPHASTSEAHRATHAGASKAHGATVVSTKRTKLGTTLVGPNGHTLYLFEADRKGRSACTGSCASEWPPLMSKLDPKAAGTAKSARLGLVSRPGGKQVTYAGHPLYYFVGDTKAGQTFGEGSNSFGAKWWALSSSGRAIEQG